MPFPVNDVTRGGASLYRSPEIAFATAGAGITFPQSPPLELRDYSYNRDGIGLW
jgi:hypothetical protein